MKVLKCNYKKILMIISVIFYMAILFSCNSNSSTNLSQVETTNNIETSAVIETNESMEAKKEEKPNKNNETNSTLKVGNTFKLISNNYEVSNWINREEKSKNAIEFRILDYDDEKVLVSTCISTKIKFNHNNGISNWKNRYDVSFEFNDVYSDKIPSLLRLDSMALANVVRNEELDCDYFILSKDEIEKYFINNNIEAAAEGSIYNESTKRIKKGDTPFILRDSNANNIYIVDGNGKIVNETEAKEYYNSIYSLYFSREYIDKILSGYYDENNELNRKIKEKYFSEQVETSPDGRMAYVKDYIGGALDVKKYGKYEILDFCKNEAQCIFDASMMFSNFNTISDVGEENELYEGKPIINTKEVRLNGLKLQECYSVERMFSQTSIEKIDFSGVDLGNVYDCYKMFDNCVKLQTILGLNLNSKSLKNLRGAFFNCRDLKELDLIDINTKNVSNMAYMFYRCQNIEHLDLSKFETSNVIDMSYMFGNMRKLKELDLSKFNTEKVTNMSHMFYRCESISELDLSSFDTKKVSNFSYMFYCCYSMKNVNITSFETNNSNKFSYFMYFCNNLEKLDFDNFTNNKRIIECNYMFRFCENLKSLNMKNADLPYLHGKYIFEGCTSLTNYNFNMSSFDKVSKDTNVLFGIRTYTGDTDNKLVFRVENNTDDTHSIYWSDTNLEWNFAKNTDNIKKQIEELKLNNDNVKYIDRQKNISNRDILFMNNDAFGKLLKNEFVVKKEYQYMEFYNYYEEARYNHFPNFVTTDSMLHTYHLYFDYLMKKVESSTLCDKVNNFSQNMLTVSKNHYNLLKNTIFEDNAKTLVAYFTVPLVILNKSFEVEDYVKNIVDEEMEKINAESYIGIRPLFAGYYKPEYKESMFNEDYSQYKPRGHYSEDEDLRKYFKVMMWYGRTNFAADYEELNKCAMLLTVYMNDVSLLSEYNSIKDIIYYFAGESDDNSIKDYTDIIKKVYGDVSLANILNNTNKYNDYVNELKNLEKSIINSSPLMRSSKENNVNFRLIGQTYTFDEEIFTNMMYDKILKKDNTKKRYLPDFLDIPAALNSDVALSILEKEGKTDYPNYMKILESFRKKLPDDVKYDNKNILYNKWFKTLYRLIENEKNDANLPSFMRSEEWKKKTLETFGGSYAELKHDTILYTKQAFGNAECGEGGGEEFYDFEEYEIDDRGYVEPIVNLYSDLKNMAMDIKNYFSGLNLLYETDIDFLNNFAELSEKLRIISEKELGNIALTNEEYELIEGYGATIEHLIIDSGAYIYDKNHDVAPQPSNAIVADMATGDRNVGDLRVLEIGTGNPIRIYVLVNIEGKYKICQGAAFDFYQFEVAPEDRMTDIEWRVAMGFDSGYRKLADGSFEYHDPEFDLYRGVDEDEEGTKRGVELTKDSMGMDFTFQNWTDTYKEKGLMFSERVNTYFINHCDDYVRKNICIENENT